MCAAARVMQVKERFLEAARGVELPLTVDSLAKVGATVESTSLVFLTKNQQEEGMKVDQEGGIDLNTYFVNYQ